MADSKKTDQNQKFHVAIVDPNKVRYEADIKRLIAPGVLQDIAILPDHTPLYAQLKDGEVEIQEISDKTVKIPIESGIIRVKMNRVSIIVGF